MNDNPDARGSLGGDSSTGLRLAALVAVVAGVLLLAAAAFVLSYNGIHQIARTAGVSARLARWYPLIFDAMLVVAGAAVLSLRTAGPWSRLYAWLTTVVLLVIVAAADAAHAMHVSLPRRASAATVAVLPWVLVLVGFGLLLAMLRHLRSARGANGGARLATGTAAARPAAVTGGNRPGGLALLLAREEAPPLSPPPGLPRRTVPAAPAPASAAGLASAAAPTATTPAADTKTAKAAPLSSSTAGDGDTVKPAVAPHFDRVRSTPTPPGEEADNSS
ncbi:MAG TPA: DUF2637 domain-containing protein [Streptosporangiaceae bacterium]|nr:DUF2637 domain-containing protein [Streptosporangiaceae bacterium]